MENKITMEELTNYCKNYGYIFQGSEIYGGLANTWDFGPLGVELKNNIKKAWTKKFIQEDINNDELKYIKTTFAISDEKLKSQELEKNNEKC